MTENHNQPEKSMEDTCETALKEQYEQKNPEIEAQEQCTEEDNTELVKRTKNKPAKILVWLCVGLILLLLMNLVMLSEIRKIKMKVQDVSYMVGSVNGSIQSIPYQINSQMEEVLKKKQSLINEFTYQLKRTKQKGIILTLMVKPKSYETDDKLYFVCKSVNGSQTIEAKSADKVTFSGDTSVSVFDSYDIDLLLENGTGRKIEKLTTLQRPVEQISSFVNAYPEGLRESYDNIAHKMNISGMFRFVSHNVDRNFMITSIKLVAQVNGKTIRTFPMQPIQQEVPNQYSVTLDNYGLSCMPGDVEKLVIMATDNSGFTYTVIVQEMEILVNGGIAPPSSMESQLYRVIVE